MELAEQGDWDEVLRLVESNAALAQAQDDFGMLPLHWACTEPSVGLDVIAALLRAFPGACQLENLSGMLPLHVAIKAKAPGVLLSALLDVYPQAALAKDGGGRYPVDLAIANGLPSFSIDVIRKAGARAVSKLHARSASTDDLTSVSSSGGGGGNNQSEDEEDDDIPMLVKTRKLSTVSSSMDPVDSSTISLQLKELLSQLHQLSVDIRVNSTSSSGSTYRSSFSSAFSSSGSAEGLTSVLWNPSDRFGIVLEPAVKEMGARIKGFSSRSDVLGVEALAVGDVLKNINGASVVNTSFASIMRFLKHSKGTCKLRFKSAADPTTASKCSTGSNPAAEQDNAMYSKVAEMLEATLKKVSAVEETVRLSSAMSLCT
ncbi:Membrane trafficking and cell signaling protein HRS [Phytophthora cinnamomi]|uniref:Membrane trafficking and cell signaling protein HRS n=1 Tax=Phytophthora cinnamomi TaxID=4785 RepID=UPI00355A3719|nr:Membrane trafficking and cell signaling protein HRS [Phytophthora cinnamomi]